VTPSSHLILCHPLLLLPPIPPSMRVFSNESDLLMRWPRYWSFSFSIIPSKEHPGLVSFRMDWLDLPAVQGTLRSLLQHHSPPHHHIYTRARSRSIPLQQKTRQLTCWCPVFPPRRKRDKSRSTYAPRYNKCTRDISAIRKPERI